MPAEIDHNSFKPVYYQLAESLRSQILEGGLKPGVQLPTEEELCKDYGVSRNTVRGTLRKLENEGLVSRTRGKGTFVCGVKRLARNLIVVSSLPPKGHRTIQELLSGVMAKAQEEGAQIQLLLDSRLDEALETAKMDSSRQHGVVFLHNKELTPEKLAKVEKAGLPYIVEGELHFPGCNFLDIDNDDAMRKATDHLYELGHRRFGIYATGEERNPHHKQRAEAAMRRLAELGVAFDPDMLVFAPYKSEEQIKTDAFSLSKLFFKKASKAPTAIICTSDTLAAMLLKWLARNGIKVPEQVSVTGFDDREFCEYVDPPLTTIRQDYYAQGEEAVSYVLRMMDDFRGKHVQTRMKMKLIERQSTGVAK